MRLIIKNTVLISILLFITSCTYDFSEDYFKEIPINKPNVNISLIGFTNGENTRSSKMVQYTINGVVNYEFEMVVRVNEVEIYRNQERTGEFYLFVDNLNDGIYNLTIEYIFPTNSGSLADALGGEFYTGGISYSFNLDKSLASPFDIASIDIIEGSIYINLNPIPDNNFEEAFLVIKNEYDYIIEERPITQEDLTDLVIHDDQTVIYNPSYSIKIRNAFKEDISDFVLLPTTKINFILDNISYNTYKFTYNGHPLYGNFDTMSIKYYDSSDSNRSNDRDLNLNPLGGEDIITTTFYPDNLVYIPTLRLYKNGFLIEEIYDPSQPFQFI